MTTELRQCMGELRSGRIAVSIAAQHGGVHAGRARAILSFWK